ncbi:MAG: AMP-binding protein [Actinobacteria bacterium]|nr:AMP-binding protein [Actinomycetota bacterium]
MKTHFATLWEAIADEIADVDAVVQGDRRFTWAEYENRASRIAAALTAGGLGPDDKVGLFLYNSPEYLETHFAAFKQRMVPINVNFRYLGRELEYLLDNADCRALFYHSSLADRVAEVIDRLPNLVLVVEVDDDERTATVPGAMRHEDLLAAHAPAPRIERSDDDVYMLYTGGTTGMPKGVMYTMGDISSAFALNGFNAQAMPMPPTVAEMAAAIGEKRRAEGPWVSAPCCPLMHGTGMWIGAMMPHCTGSTVALLPSKRFDADELLELVEQERVAQVVIVGDAFARPIADALDAAARSGRAFDTSSLQRMTSSGVMWTAEIKQRLLDHIPDIMLVDAMGSTEGGMAASISTRDVKAPTAKFVMNPTTRVFDDDDVEVLPGDGRTGKVANGGLTPFGYFKDPEKSARTFRVIGGVRYSFPGDLATFDENGQLVLLGRGSQVINTAGEKVFPEEVEEAVKRVAGIADCLVVGLPDDKWGQIVVAVASIDGTSSPSENDVIASVKTELSGYKAPKRVVFCAEVPRAPNGKADYPGAKAIAEADVRG